MNQSPLAFAFQEAETGGLPIWIILLAVVIILFLIVVVVAQSDLSLSTGPSASAYAGMAHPETAQPAPEPTPAPPIVESPSPVYESPSPAYESPSPAYESPAPVYEDSPPAASTADTAPFDPSRTVAIIRENTVPISYGTIKFVSGVLAGQEFQVEPEGSFIGRESTLSKIVISDPRISKRHLWIGVRDGVVRIVDQDSRNGTFINDPKSQRITEAVLNSGDTVIMGESDVARFEFQTA